MRISQNLNNWLCRYGFDVNTKKDSDFCYYYDDECIHWSMNSTEHDKYYLKFINTLGYNKDFDIKTVSFLHELGHHELEDDYTNLDFFLDRFKQYIEGDCRNEFELGLRSNLYYRLPTEYKATKWMVDFTNLFYKEAEELDLIFRGKYNV